MSHPKLTEEYMRLMADLIKSVTPAGLGFSLVVFEFGEDHSEKQIRYISNAQREDMIPILEQQVASLKLKSDLPPHQQN